jgi:hypothetical protein
VVLAVVLGACTTGALLQSTDMTGIPSIATPHRNQSMVTEDISLPPEWHVN